MTKVNQKIGNKIKQAFINEIYSNLTSFFIGRKYENISMAYIIDTSQFH